MSKRQWLLVIEAALFLAASYCCFRLVGFLVSEVGSSFATLGKYLPFYLLVALPIYAVLVFHFAIHPISPKRRLLTLKVNGIVFCALSFLIVLISAIYLLNGTYSVSRIGGISWLFPLDAIILGVVGSFLGGGCYFYVKKHPETSDPYRMAPCRNIYLKILKAVGFSLGLFASLWATGGLLSVFSTFDYLASDPAGVLAVYLLLAYPGVQWGFYEYGYLEEANLKKKAKKARLYSAVLLIVGLALSLFYWGMQNEDPYLIADSFMALFPIDIASSLPIGSLVLYLLSTVPALAAFFFSLLPPKAQKRA